MSARIFIDSNIFLYTLDRHDAQKKALAEQKLLAASSEFKVTVSTQVLNEIFVVATKKLGIDPVSAKEFIRGLYNFEVILVTPRIIESAIDCSVLSRINYWDALMVACAEEGHCTALWTEDMSDGQLIRGVTIHNPLR